MKNDYGCRITFVTLFGRNLWKRHFVIICIQCFFYAVLKAKAEV